MKNCFMWKHHGHTVPCHFGCTDVCQIGLSRSRGGGPFLANFVASLNPVAWYRYGAGITVTGAGVSSWADQSGNGNHLLQGTDGNRPALQSDGSILFDGVDNFLSATYTLNQPLTVYLLGKQITWTGTDRLISGVAATVVINQVTASPQIGLNAGSAAAANGGLALDTYGVISAVFNGASSSLQINNAAPTTGNAGANNPGGFVVGAASAGLNASNIEVKEFIVSPAAHDAGQRAKVISYLAQVGNLTI